MEAKRNRIKILYSNKDISADLAPYNQTFGFDDMLSGQADSLNLTLEDCQGLWRGDWMPEKGAMLQASILSGEKELSLGRFEIDEIEISAAPAEAKIKAVSVPNNSALRGVDKNRSWEKVKLSLIAKDIATNADMTLFYDTEIDPELDRAEQTEQSDLSFLQKLCNDAGLALKITDLQIVIFDEAKYEEQEPIDVLEFGKDFKSCSFRTKTKEIYAACHVKYQVAKTKEKIEATFIDPSGRKGKILEINKQVKNISEAERLAKKELRNKNKDETTGRLELEGNIKYLAGLTVEIKNMGWFDGKYLIVKSAHNIGSGYSTSLDLRRCLNGY